MKIWAIRVGPRVRGYIMDNKVFDTKREAVEYKKSMCPCSWSNDWHIIQLEQVKK